MGYVNTLMMRVKIDENPDLKDDNVVEECMNMLIDKYPEITGYIFERTDPRHIQILMWGDIDISDES